jgi:hypothetical protein
MRREQDVAPADSGSRLESGKRWGIAAFVTALALAGAASSGAVRDERDVVVVNRTGKVIESLFVSEVASDDWEDDVLGDDVLGDGDSVEVSFAGYDAGVCHFDILATNDAGDSWLLADVDLCKATTVTITPGDVRVR